MSVVCPVCEHPQAHGNECDVCGKRLAQGPSAADLVLPPVDGLEPTLHAAIDTGSERVPDLEPTLHAAAIDDGEDATVGLEPTRAAPVYVDVEQAPDIEQTCAAAIPGDARTALPATLVCRYCRTPAAPGERICSRCGMRLPVARADAKPAAVDSDGWRCTCGALARGSLCPTCGARRASR